MKKYLKVMLILVVALSLLGTVAFANVNPFDFTGNATTGNAGQAMKNIGATIVSLVKTFGFILAVIMVLVTGIQYLIGTPAKKQELKGKLINVIIGAVLIVGATQLLGVIYSVANSTATGLTNAGGQQISQQKN